MVSDALGSACVPAACCGVYCYRATPGALGQPNAAAAAAAAGGQPEGWQESLAVMAADPNVLLKAAQTLGAPGGWGGGWEGGALGRWAERMSGMSGCRRAGLAMRNGGLRR